jgi:hypothetical protein
VEQPVAVTAISFFSGRCGKECAASATFKRHRAARSSRFGAKTRSPNSGDSTMKTAYRNIITVAAFAVAATLSAPVVAQEATPWPELMMKSADKNKDGMVSRQEYLDMAAKMWDEKHRSMMKSDPSMKAGMMDKAKFITFVKSVFIDPGQIGGN